jgi:hypothetical protein
MMSTTNRHGRTRTVLAALALTTVVAAGCSAADQSEPASDDAAVMEESTGDGADSDADEAVEAETGGAGEDGAAQGKDAAGPVTTQDESEEESGSATSQTLPEGRMIARDATLSVEVEDVAPGSSRVRAAAAAAEGYVVQEEVHPGDEQDRGFATIVISVPTANLDQALSQLEEIGEVTERGMSSLDVTADYVDTSARIATLEVSVERTRGLMGDATSIEDVVALERELSSREADLDALNAHAAALEGDVSRSTVTVSLTEPVDAEETPVEEAAAGGFLHGLERGWDAFTTAGSAALTALGAVLPFAGLAALVALPVLALRRRRTRREVAAST